MIPGTQRRLGKILARISKSQLQGDFNKSSIIYGVMQNVQNLLIKGCRLNSGGYRIQPN